MRVDVPILYCCYNRPYNVKKSIAVLKNIKAKNIYIVCDGPKKNISDIKKCNSVKKILNHTNFRTKPIFKFRKKNLGCKNSISQAITWFFKNEKSGIILEDDLIPSYDFFKFCEYGLKRYKNSRKIRMISGTNYIGFKNHSNNYFFSKHYIIWGWATWKDAWSKYDVEMKDWNKQTIKNKIQKYNTKAEFKFLNERFTQFQNEYKDTWDIQWYFTCTKNNWLTMTPETNLVTNIGIKGTHSNKYYDTLHLRTGKIDFKVLKGPSQIKNNEDFDLEVNNYFNFKNNLMKKFYYKLKYKLNKYLLNY